MSSFHWRSRQKIRARCVFSNQTPWSRQSFLFKTQWFVHGVVRHPWFACRRSMHFLRETHVLVSCRVYMGTFDQRSAQRPPGSCLTSPCCRDFILFRIFAAQILVPLCVSLTRRHFGAFLGGQEISAYIYNLTFLAFFFSTFWGPKNTQDSTLRIRGAKKDPPTECSGG